MTRNATSFDQQRAVEAGKASGETRRRRREEKRVLRASVAASPLNRAEALMLLSLIARERGKDAVPAIRLALELLAQDGEGAAMLDAQSRIKDMLSGGTDA